MGLLSHFKSTLNLITYIPQRGLDTDMSKTKWGILLKWTEYIPFSISSISLKDDNLGYANKVSGKIHSMKIRDNP